ncbi:malate synthase A [Luedemannella helvata]|uniref:malate synthase n=1 Tax=Luedemannella helvata TaxID=349315 RepID=A0ABP4WGQ7_9ACTN
MTAAPPTATVLTDAVDTDGVLTEEALSLVATLQRTYGHARSVLLTRRSERAAAYAAGTRPGLDPATAHIRDGDWSVPPAPRDLTDRRCEITGPADRKMMISALNSGARVFLCDLEDALAPTWANIVDGHRNLRDWAAGTLTFTRPDGTVDTVGADPATIVVRPRGLHLNESRVAVDGAPVAAGLFDITVAAVLAGRERQAAGSALYLYLPKIESHHEAQWWDALIGDVERRVGLAPRSVRVTVLIETITAAYEMEEILFALRERITGLNAGRWDYIFSVIKKFGTDPAHVLPDRQKVTMTVPFLAAYAQRLVAVAHRRGAHAIGGMAALIPSRRDAEANARAFAAVRADKEREAGLGYDGTWVAHPDLVPVATEVFDAALGDAPNQLAARPEPAAPVEALLDTTVEGATVTAAGVAGNVSVALRYLAAWLGGLGAVGVDGLMEDLATAEISRSQLWQWIHHGVALPDGTVVTADLVEGLIGAEVDRLVADGGDADLLDAAADALRRGALRPVLPDFVVGDVA